MEQKNDGRGGGGKIKIGVCVMEKKVRVLGEIFEFFLWLWIAFLVLAAMRGWSRGRQDYLSAFPVVSSCLVFLQVSCSPMEQILERLHAFGEFEVRLGNRPGSAGLR
jgi:hypothetical protein